MAEGSLIVTAFIRPFCCEASDGKKKRVSFSERILLPTVCAQKTLLQPGFSGVKKEAGATAPTPPPLWRPRASPHLLFCLGSGGWGWRTAPPPAALRGRPPRALRVSLTRGPHSASPRGPPRPLRGRGGGGGTGASPTRLPAVVPAHGGFPALSPGAAGLSSLGRTSHRPGLSGLHARGSPDLRRSYKSAQRGSGLPLCSTPTTPGTQEQVPPAHLPAAGSAAGEARPTSSGSTRPTTREPFRTAPPSSQEPGPRPTQGRAASPEDDSESPAPT